MRIIYHVETGMTSGGPTFASRTEALRHANYVLRSAADNDEAVSIRIWTERQRSA